MQLVRNRANEILHTLKASFSVQQWASSNKNSFETLIMTVLSQSTTDKNAAKAFENLSKKSSITPQALAKASMDKIEEAIRIGGLYRNKSRVVQAISREILEKFNSSLDFIHTIPLEQARKILLALPGVGPKTADVVLLFCAKKPTIPIDTHVNRVSKRLQLTSPKDDYPEIQRKLTAVYLPEDYLSVHLLLIALGRTYCKSRKPLCGSCPVNALCPSKGLES